MPKRLLTFLLLLTVLVPTSLLGSTLHHCGMMNGGPADRVERPSCCSGTSFEIRGGENNVQGEQLSHECDVALGDVRQQLATTTFKTQYEAPNPAEWVPVSIVFRLPDEFLSRFPAGASFSPLAGNLQPVFLRNCSFLI